LIDWIKCKLPVLHSPVATGSFLLIAPDGSIERESMRSLSVEGSWSSTMRVISGGSDGKGNAEYLEISGNPAKFLQGHNVFGTDNLLELVFATAMKLFENLNLTPSDFDRHLIKTGNYYVNWIDINYSYELRNQSDVQAWIKAAEFSARTRVGRPINKTGTLYFQKHSRRWAIKAYSKFNELNGGKGHCLPQELENTGLKEWTENILRVELRLLGKELRNIGIDKAYQLTPEKCKALYTEYLGKLIMTDQLKLKDDIAFDLPSSLRSTYTLWRDGYSIIDMVSHSTFYRHRKALLELGVDISISCKKETTNVIPLIRVLEAKPAHLPQWAHDQGLIYSAEIRSITN
jgi:II/X family phage/plasmid replication protein